MKMMKLEDLQQITWTSVKQMLPDMNRRVLVYCDHPEGGYQTVAAYTDWSESDAPTEPGWWSVSLETGAEEQLSGVAYWRLLPENPKEL